MNTGLDVRAAIRDANAVFGRFPAWLCLLPVLLGLFSCVTTEWYQPDLQHLDGPYILLYFLCFVVGGLVLFWLCCFIEVVVSSMFLRAREGEEPGGWQLGEAWRYRGFTTLAGGLLLRYIGWGLVIVLPLAIAIGVITAIMHEIAGATSGISATVGGVGAAGQGNICAVMGALSVIITAPIFCRYMFAFQMFAIERRSGQGFLDECVARTKKAWKTAAALMIAGMIPAYMVLGLESLAWKHWTPSHGRHMAVEVAGVILTGCVTAWFILVKTGLAMQLMAVPASAVEPIGDGAAI